jgi:Scavenger mRNA decapping enzyme C-term binding
MQIDHDDKVLVMHDAYPKARHHILVIALDPGLLDISCLRSCHVPLLQHMRARAAAWFDARAAPVGRVCS